jgi:hypothetical protein
MSQHGTAWYIASMVQHGTLLQQAMILRTTCTTSSTCHTSCFWCHNYLYIDMCWCQPMSTNDRKWPLYESCLARSSWFWGQFQPKAVQWMSPHISGVITTNIYIYMSWCQTMSTNDRKWPPYDSCLARSSWIWGQFLPKAVHWMSPHISRLKICPQMTQSELI